MVFDADVLYYYYRAWCCCTASSRRVTKPFIEDQIYMHAQPTTTDNIMHANISMPLHAKASYSTRVADARDKAPFRIASLGADHKLLSLCPSACRIGWVCLGDSSILRRRFNITCKGSDVQEDIAHQKIDMFTRDNYKDTAL